MFRQTSAYQFVVHASGKFVGREWFDAGASNLLDQVQDRAGFHARMVGAEIDICECLVMPSGRVGGVERIGVRVRP